MGKGNITARRTGLAVEVAQEMLLSIDGYAKLGLCGPYILLRSNECRSL